MQNVQFKKWTEMEEQQLMNEFEQGLDIAEMAKKHNRSIRAIQIRLSDIAVKLNKAGVSLPAIFKSTGQTENDIIKRKAEIALEKDPHRVHDLKQSESISKYDTIMAELKRMNEDISFIKNNLH